MTFRDWLHSILNLFYPRVCAACGESLLKDEETVCLKCRYLLPKTGYENNPENPLAQSFYGRVRFHAVTACFFFAKSGKVQHLIHELKYRGNKEAGVFLGQELGKTIKDAPLFQGIDYLIPVPLHPKRERQASMRSRAFQLVINTWLEAFIQKRRRTKPPRNVSRT